MVNLWRISMWWKEVSYGAALFWSVSWKKQDIWRWDGNTFIKISLNESRYRMWDGTTALLSKYLYMRADIVVHNIPRHRHTTFISRRRKTTKAFHKSLGWDKHQQFWKSLTNISDYEMLNWSAKYQRNPPGCACVIYDACPLSWTFANFGKDFIIAGCQLFLLLRHTAVHWWLRSHQTNPLYRTICDICQ